MDGSFVDPGHDDDHDVRVGDVSDHHRNLHKPPPFPQQYTAGFPGYYKYPLTLTATDSTGTSPSSMNVYVCPDVDLITAQGILAEPGLYSPLSQFTQAFTNSDQAQGRGAIEVQPISWTSLQPQPLLSDIVTAYQTGHYNLVSGKLTFPGEEDPSLNSNYYQNVQAGKAALTDVVSGLAKYCPATKLVLLGYSEGSDAMLQYLQGIQGGSANIAAAYVYGSPRFNPAYQSINSTGISGVPSHVDVDEGLLGEVPYRALTKSTCFPTDPICQGLKMPTAWLAACLSGGPKDCAAITVAQLLFGYTHTLYGSDAAADGKAEGSKGW